MMFDQIVEKIVIQSDYSLANNLIILPIYLVIFCNNIRALHYNFPDVELYLFKPDHFIGPSV